MPTSLSLLTARKHGFCAFVSLPPFSALVGYDDAVAETARLTEARPELDEQEQRAINERLVYIAEHIHEQPEVKVQYFVPDDRKSGGRIMLISGKVKKISATDGTIVMADGYKIPTIDVIAISDSIF